jgi:hypothetical protein
MRKIVIDGIEITITRKRIKNIHLKVKTPDGRVEITAPVLVSQQRIEKFALSRIEWVKKHRSRILKMSPQPVTEYLTGETHFLCGKPYSLIVLEESAKDGVEISGNQIVLKLKGRGGVKRRETVLYNWYKSRLNNLIPHIVEKWEPIMGVSVKEFSLRKMRSRWGSCNPLSAKITINLELAKRSDTILEYIVVHEMTHLLERGHNNRFYRYMDQWIPEWREYRKELRRGIS